MGAVQAQHIVNWNVSTIPEHRKSKPERWMESAERMRANWNCYDFQCFINDVK